MAQGAAECVHRRRRDGLADFHQLGFGTRHADGARRLTWKFSDRQLVSLRLEKMGQGLHLKSLRQQGSLSQALGCLQLGGRFTPASMKARPMKPTTSTRRQREHGQNSPFPMVVRSAQRADMSVTTFRLEPDRSLSNCGKEQQ